MSEFPPPKGEPPTVSWEPCCALQADPAYQRNIDGRASKKLIHKIATEWDWRLCAPLTVSHRPDEGGEMAYFVIDGQHRLAAAELRGDILELPCIISQFESFEAEALAFVAINRDRKSVTGLDRFHARIAAKEPVAVEIKALVESAGLTVARSNDAAQWKPKEVAFPDLIGARMGRDKTAAARALVALARAYAAPLLRGADLFVGLWTLALRNRLPAEVWEQLPAKIGAAKQSIWLARRDRFRSEHDCTPEEAMASVFADAVGDGARSPVLTPAPITAAPGAPRWAQSIAAPSVTVPPSGAFTHKASDLPEDAKTTWCEQCDKRVSAMKAANCTNKFCKAKARAAA